VPELAIVGTGGLAKEVAQLARRIDPRGERWPKLFYVAETRNQLGTSLLFGEVTCVDADLAMRRAPCDVVVAIGYPQIRRMLACKLTANGALSFPNLVHPRTVIDAALVHMGQGNLVTEGVVMTCDIRIGNFNLFNWNVTVGHDAVIGNYNVVNPGSNVSGHCHIGDGCLLGTGSQVLERLSVTSDCIIGAGAVVTRGLSQAGTYVGVPARRQR